MRPLVTIIIPTYNRDQLIGETLDSIRTQTYHNWECIVVDDGSTDHTKELLGFYCEKDDRIKYYLRPNGFPKGANSCRNYGFDHSKGKYVKWFDSDDIMYSQHLQTLVDAIHGSDLDFVIGDTINFRQNESIKKKPFSFNREEAEIKVISFAKGQIGWITDDFLVLKSVVNNLKFNENLRAGQEYNFFTRLLFKTENGIFVNKVLTKARLHSGSLSMGYRQNEIRRQKIISEIKILTLKDIFNFKEGELNKWYLSGYIQLAFKLAVKNARIPYVFLAIGYMIKINNPIKTISFILSIISAYCFKSGYKLNKFSRI
jgi:glycosyltransferase involved in cell wall biosynthesis